MPQIVYGYDSNDSKPAPKNDCKLYITYINNVVLLIPVTNGIVGNIRYYIDQSK